MRISDFKIYTFKHRLPAGSRFLESKHRFGRLFWLVDPIQAIQLLFTAFSSAGSRIPGFIPLNEILLLLNILLLFLISINMLIFIDIRHFQKLFIICRITG
ncbi:hypothetical protein D3C77_537250 [compost metagenome]